MPQKKTKKPAPDAEPRHPDRMLVLTRIFDAPRELVFEAWTKPEHLNRWCAPKGFTIPHSEGDIRPGGFWRTCMRTPDGFDCWLSGTYREIEPPEFIRFTHAWEEDGKRGHETVVTIRLTPYGQKTKLMLEQGLFDSKPSRDGHRGGWSECLDRLAELLVAFGRPTPPRRRPAVSAPVKKSSPAARRPRAKK